MSFVNPLHAPVSARQNTSYSTLAGAMTPRGSAPTQGDSKRKRLEQRIYYPSGKWHAATRKQLAHPPISFDYRGRKGSGIPMSDLSARAIPGIISVMDGGEDKVLASTGQSRISFRIMWPGYESSSEWVRSIEVLTNGPITRAQLGQCVAQNFARFVERHRDAPSSMPENRIACNNIRFEHLILVSMCNTFDDSWQADVIIDLK